MNNLTIDDLIAYLIYLLGPQRREALNAIEVARVFAANTLDPTLVALQALPAEDYGGTPNADQIAEVDAVHDGNGLALMYLALAYKASPTASKEAKATADLILEKWVPNKAHLRARVATEVGRAETRRPMLTTDKAALDRLPVEGGTAHAWASGYVEAGLELGMLLADRAGQDGVRGSAPDLRRQAIGDVMHLRDSIAKALRSTPDGGREQDRHFFGYLDHLVGLRESGSKAPPPPPPPVEPTPAG